MLTVQFQHCPLARAVSFGTSADTGGSLLPYYRWRLLSKGCVVKRLFSALALVWLASGCGGPSNPPALPVAERPAVATAGVTTIPPIFSVFPADTKATGVPDTAPHPTMQRIVIQAPANTEIRLRAGATDIPFSRATLEMTDGRVLHELSLERPLGDVNATLTTCRPHQPTNRHTMYARPP